MKSKNQMMRSVAIVFSALMLIQCNTTPKQKSQNINNAVSIEKSTFGITENGATVDLYTLTNTQGVKLDVITYGGRIVSLKVPDNQGKFENIVLGFDNLQDYENSNPFFGALIGRYGNRIANGSFEIDGVQYTLAKNDGPNHLHGGNKGYDSVLWNATPSQSEEEVSLTLTYSSKDGEEGYPGNLDISVVYTLTNDNELQVSYLANTDKATVVNLTQHAYFNLSGDFSNDILSHEVVIAAEAFLPVDDTLIPTGEIRAVADTPFDFNNPKKIGKQINDENLQLKRGKGYDHCWVLVGEKGNMRFAASAYDQNSGRFMEIYTEEPAIQFYTGNFLDGTLPMPGGGHFAHRTGFCLETQHYPNTPNQAEFPSTTLQPGETYSTKTTFKFSTK